MIDAQDFPINCTGDVCVGDTILLSEAVFGGSFKKPKYLGERQITAKVIADSYGSAKQQHTFTIEVLASDGYEPLSAGERIMRKGRNLYRNGTRRQAWTDESGRRAALDEKHSRGDEARAARDVRKGIQ